ncbi:uncharacterized protein O3C94_022166 [Discoglossus pictus]
MATSTKETVPRWNPSAEFHLRKTQPPSARLMADKGGASADESTSKHESDSLNEELSSDVIKVIVTEPYLSEHNNKVIKEETINYMEEQSKESPDNGSECDENAPSNNSQHRPSKGFLAGRKTFECPECGKCFSQRSRLASHESVHTSAKPFTCSECGKGFKHKGDLLRHETLHTGLKPFECTECGKCFSRKATLINHERIHTDEKPFPCADCGKCFRKKSSLVDHERLHTRVKPFSCSECGLCFSQKSYLVKHEKIHKVGKPSP